MMMMGWMRRRVAGVIWAWTACIVEWCIWRNVSRSVGLIKSLERGVGSLLSGIEVRSEELRSGIVRVVHAHHRVEAHWKSEDFWCYKIRIVGKRKFEIMEEYYFFIIKSPFLVIFSSLWPYYCNNCKLPHDMWKRRGRQSSNWWHSCPSKIEGHLLFCFYSFFEVKLCLFFCSCLSIKWSVQVWVKLVLTALPLSCQTWSLGGGPAVGSAPTLRLDHPRRSLAPRFLEGHVCQRTKRD